MAVQAPPGWTAVKVGDQVFFWPSSQPAPTSLDGSHGFEGGLTHFRIPDSWGKTPPPEWRDLYGAANRASGVNPSEVYAQNPVAPATPATASSLPDAPKQQESPPFVRTDEQESGKTAEAIKRLNAQADESQSALATANAGVLKAIMQAHTRTEQGRDQLNQVQKEFEEVSGKVDMKTPAGAKQMFHMIDNRLSDIQRIIDSNVLDNASTAGLLAAKKNLYEKIEAGDDPAAPQGENPGGGSGGPGGGQGVSGGSGGAPAGPAGGGAGEGEQIPPAPNLGLGGMGGADPLGSLMGSLGGIPGAVGSALGAPMSGLSSLGGLGGALGSALGPAFAQQADQKPDLDTDRDEDRNRHNGTDNQGNNQQNQGPQNQGPQNGQPNGPQGQPNTPPQVEPAGVTPPAPPAPSDEVAIQNGPPSKAANTDLAAAARGVVDGKDIPTAYRDAKLLVPAVSAPITADQAVNPKDLMCGDLGSVGDRWVMAWNKDTVMLDGQLHPMRDLANYGEMRGWIRPTAEGTATAVSAAQSGATPQAPATTPSASAAK